MLSIAFEEPPVLATSGSGAVGGADCGSRLGVAGLPEVFRVGPSMGKDVWVRRLISEACGNSPSSGGSVMTLPSASRGISPEPTRVRDFSELKRTRARVALRETTSKYSFKAGSSDARAH